MTKPQSLSKFTAITGLIFLPLILLVGMISVGFNGFSAGPNPRGAQAQQIADITDPAIQDLINQMELFENPQSISTASSASLSNLKAALQDVLDGIENKRSGFEHLNEKSKKTITGLIESLDSLMTEQGSDKKKRSEQSEKIYKTLQELNLSSFGSINCGGGGNCLDVPVVHQGKGNWCGKTSVLMAVLFYNQNKPTDKIAKLLKTTSSGDWISAGFGNSAHVSPAAMSTGSGKDGWTYAPAPKDGSALYQAIKKSIDGGDPVILYTNGAFYPQKNGRGHIVTAVGYNETNKSIYVNNPRTLNERGTVRATNRGWKGALLTGDYLYANNGDATYSGHTFIIRKTYL
jgi:hypothetical protein